MDTLLNLRDFKIIEQVCNVCFKSDYNIFEKNC